MDRIRKRAEDKFPMVLLTLLSIVQALALEFFWDHIRHRTEIFELNVTALIAWLQIAASLNGIILIWLMYAGMLMRFRWTPTTTDSVLPFLVGLIQFLMIDLMGPGKLGHWLVILGLIFGAMNIINHRAMKRARLDPANAEFFDRFSPARARDFVPQIATVAALLLAGAWIWFRGSEGWFAVCVLVATLVGLGREVHDAARYWDYSMGRR